MNIAAAGVGVKNLAIGVAIFGALLGIAWVIRNREKFDPTSDKNLAYQAASGLVEVATGVEGDTVGTALHRLFNSDAPTYDEQQALKSCRLIYSTKGVVMSAVCRELLDKYGPS